MYGQAKARPYIRSNQEFIDNIILITGISYFDNKWKSNGLTRNAHSLPNGLRNGEC